MAANSTQLYEFGPFCLDPAERLLTRHGHTVHLPPKAFDTLVVLIENRGKLMEKDELLRRIWPDAVVEEGNLSVTIFSLRKWATVLTVISSSPRFRSADIVLSPTFAGGTEGCLQADRHGGTRDSGSALPLL
jgi:two-component SAPR family response regulator